MATTRDDSLPDVSIVNGHADKNIALLRGRIEVNSQSRACRWSLIDRKQFCQSALRLQRRTRNLSLSQTLARRCNGRNVRASV